MQNLKNPNSQYLRNDFLRNEERPQGQNANTSTQKIVYQHTNVMVEADAESYSRQSVPDICFESNVQRIGHYQESKVNSPEQLAQIVGKGTSDQLHH